jgi:hypothetical protein
MLSLVIEFFFSKFSFMSPNPSSVQGRQSRVPLDDERRIDRRAPKSDCFAFYHEMECDGLARQNTLSILLLSAPFFHFWISSRKIIIHNWLSSVVDSYVRAASGTHSGSFLPCSEVENRQSAPFQGSSTSQFFANGLEFFLSPG